MGWLKVDDKLLRNPKVLAGDIETAWYYLCALTHCAEQLTDGYIADAVLPLIAPHITDPRSVAEKCAQLGMFRHVEGGYPVGDHVQPVAAGAYTQYDGTQYNIYFFHIASP